MEYVEALTIDFERRYQENQREKRRGRKVNKKGGADKPRQAAVAPICFGGNSRGSTKKTPRDTPNIQVK